MGGNANVIADQNTTVRLIAAAISHQNGVHLKGAVVSERYISLNDRPIGDGGPLPYVNVSRARMDPGSCMYPAGARQTDTLMPQRETTAEPKREALAPCQALRHA